LVKISDEGAKPTVFCPCLTACYTPLSLNLQVVIKPSVDSFVLKLSIPLNLHLDTALVQEFSKVFWGVHSIISILMGLDNPESLDKSKETLQKPCTPALNACSGYIASIKIIGFIVSLFSIAVLIRLGVFDDSIDVDLHATSKSEQTNIDTFLKFMPILV